MKILVTGSNGTIGTQLCLDLLEKGYEVVGIDKRENQFSEKVGELTVKWDLIKDIPEMKELENVDVVIHLAANARVYDLVVEPDLSFENVEIMYRVLEYARKKKIKHFMFGSSREVYGNQYFDKTDEDKATIKECESNYTASKVYGEAMCHAYHGCYKSFESMVIFRFSNVYGKYDLSDRFIPLMIEKAIKNEEITVFGEDKILDFTYLTDCTNGIILTMEAALNKKIKKEVLNIAYGEGTKLVDAAKEIINVLGSKSKLTIEDNRTGEVVHYVADISRAKKLINYEPKVDVSEGIKKSIDYYKEKFA